MLNASVYVCTCVCQPTVSVLCACPFFKSNSICYRLLINVDMNNVMNGLAHACMHMCACA